MKAVGSTLPEVFKPSFQGRSLNRQEQEMQTVALSFLIAYSGLNESGKNAAAKQSLAGYYDLLAANASPEIPCSYDGGQDDKSFFRNNRPQSISLDRIAPLMTARLKKIEALYKQQRMSVDRQTRDFYDYRLLIIQELFKP